MAKPRKGGQELPDSVQDRPEQNRGYDDAVRGERSRDQDDVAGANTEALDEVDEEEEEEEEDDEDEAEELDESDDDDDEEDEEDEDEEEDETTDTGA